MNLEELRKTMESEATVENKELKEELEHLKKTYRRKMDNMHSLVDGLTDDCRALSNRCYVLTRGQMCVFCDLREFQCEHALNLDEMLKIDKEPRKENKNV